MVILCAELIVYIYPMVLKQGQTAEAQRRGDQKLLTCILNTVIKTGTLKLAGIVNDSAPLRLSGLISIAGETIHRPYFS